MQGSPLFKLTMRQGPRPEQTFELSKDVYTVGREAGNDIIINDAQVSRHHARLTLQGGAYVLEDLGSTNGSFVNGRRLTGPMALSPGDMVGLGDTVVLAVSGAADMAVTQVARARDVPSTVPKQAPAPPPPVGQAAATPYATPTVKPAASPSSSRRMIVIGLAGLALAAVICMACLVAWSFIECNSFSQFWRLLPILSSIPISC